MILVLLNAVPVRESSINRASRVGDEVLGSGTSAVYSVNFWAAAAKPPRSDGGPDSVRRVLVEPMAGVNA